MKKEYNKPTIEITEIELEDIIAASKQLSGSGVFDQFDEIFGNK